MSSHTFSDYARCFFFMLYIYLLKPYTVKVRNTFKGLDLIESLVNYGCRFVILYRRQGSGPSPWKRNAKKAKWLSEEALKIAVKRREAKSKGEKERYSHLNAEFQRIEWLGLFIPNVGFMGSIPGQGTKIPNAAWCDQIKI